MANTYTWSITQLNCHSQQEEQANVVYSVAWQCIGSNGAISVTINGLSQLTYDSANPFINYAQLTEQQVLNWVYNTDVNKSQLESYIDSYLVSLTTPRSTVMQLPWVSTTLS